MDEKMPESNWQDSLAQEGQAAFEKAQMSDEDRRKKLMRWAFRQVLTVVLVWFLRDKSWINILIWVWIPLAILSLLSILYYNRVLDWRMKRFQKKMDSLRNGPQDQEN